MNDGSKMAALPHDTLRERLLSKRQDAKVTANNASNTPAPPKPDAKPAPAATEEIPPQRICAYAKCPRKGAPFVPRRKGQLCCTADCRKRKWFDAHYAPIPKP